MAMKVINGIRYRPEDVPETKAMRPQAGRIPTKAGTPVNKSKPAAKAAAKG